MKARPLRHVILRISNRKGAHRQSSGRAEVAHQRFWVVCICSASAQGAQAAAHPQDQLMRSEEGRVRGYLDGLCCVWVSPILGGWVAHRVISQQKRLWRLDI